MILAFFIGGIMGILVAILPGPLSLAVFHRAVNAGVRPAAMVAAGGMVFETVYAFVGFAGIQLVEMAGLGTAVHLLSAAVLLLLGGVYTFGPIPLRDRSEREQRFGHAGEFLLGLVLCGLTPTIAAAYFMLAGLLHSFGIFSTTVETNLAASLGAGTGSMMWMALMIALLHRLKRSLNPAMLQCLSRGSGGLLLAVGIYSVVSLLFHQGAGQ